MNAMVRYEWGMFNGTMAGVVTASYQGETYFDIQNPEIAEEDGYTVTNIRLGWTSPEDRYEIAAFVDNVTDEEYLVYTFDFTGAFGFNQQGYGRPRWAGVTARFNF